MSLGTKKVRKIAVSWNNTQWIFSIGHSSDFWEHTGWTKNNGYRHPPEAMGEAEWFFFAKFYFNI